MDGRNKRKAYSNPNEFELMRQYQEDIASLYSTQKFSDVTFIVNGQKIPAHKNILAVRSKYFELLLFGHLKEASQSEITLTGLSEDAFLAILGFLYSGRVPAVNATWDFKLEVLELANKYLLQDLEMCIAKELIYLLDVNNVVQLMQKAEMYELSELHDNCMKYIDMYGQEMLNNAEFKSQSKETLIHFLGRKTFDADELSIFKFVAEWCEMNGKDPDLLKCVNLSPLSVEQIRFVKSTGLLDDGLLTDAINERLNSNSTYLPTPKFFNINVAAFDHKAQVIINGNAGDLSFVLKGNVDDEKFASCPIGGEGLTVKLASTPLINNIKLLLRIGPKNKYYRYDIKTSIDGITWHNTINYNIYDCRGLQQLYFQEQQVRYIKVSGTYSSADNTLDIVSLQAFRNDTIPKLHGGVICPLTNVALLSKSAVILEGNTPGILNGKICNPNGTNHKIGRGSILIQLAQPYLIDTIKLWLYEEKNPISYKYCIECSINKTEWAMVVDNRSVECKSWQNLTFSPRRIVYLRITGTSTSDSNNNFFCCHHIQCYASQQ